MRIIIGGALGRMGRELAAAAEARGVSVACGVDIAWNGQELPFPMATGYEQTCWDADALIDFSRPEALSELLSLCEKRKLPAVLCATGYADKELALINQASQSIALLRSANMSMGVQVLRELVAIACRALGDDYDVEIVEKHHRMKVDSPSGTALSLYETASDARGGMEAVYGRRGRTQRRAPGEIGIHAVRGGTLTGEHEVGFYGDGEQLILTHRAENRSLFAAGALQAARFLHNKPAGLYDMRDVVAQTLRDATRL